MKPRPLIIPIFIPQAGCRHRCVYCDQPTISGASQASWSPSSIRKHVVNYLDNGGRYPVQVAFYGGSFTLLPEARQRLFLESVQEFLEQGLVPREDKDISKELTRSFKKAGINVLAGTSVEAVDTKGKGCKVTVKNRKTEKEEIAQTKRFGVLRDVDDCSVLCG